LGGPNLTWDHEPSSGLGSGAHVAVAAVAAARAAVAATAPAVTAVGLTQAAAAAVSDLKKVAVEGSRPSARPGPEVRAP
jgi:homoserine kinase